MAVKSHHVVGKAVRAAIVMLFQDCIALVVLASRCCRAQPSRGLARYRASFHRFRVTFVRYFTIGRVLNSMAARR